MLGSGLSTLYYSKHQVYALHRDKKCYTQSFIDFSLDLTNDVEVKKIINEIEPDVLIHCAGNTDIDYCENNEIKAYQANVTVTENLLQSCYEKTKFVYISTDQVYGSLTNAMENNEDLEPLNIYGKTKLLGEKKVEELFANHIIIRTNIFGWNIKPGKVSSAEWMFNSLMNGKEIVLFKDYTFSPIYTKYLGQIIMELYKENFTGIINIGANNTCSKYEFGYRMADDFGFDLDLIKIGSMAGHKFLAKRHNSLNLNTQKITNLNIKLPTIGKSIQWFKQDKFE